MAQMRNDIEELEAKAEELQRQYESIQERFRNEESCKNVSDFGLLFLLYLLYKQFMLSLISNLNIQIAIKSYEEEKEARVAVEKSRNALSDELVKGGQEAKRLDDLVIIQFSICI